MKKNNSSSDESQDTQLKYLELIAALLLESQYEGNQTRQIEFLVRQNFTSQQIAGLLGKDPTQVSKDIYKIKNRKS